MLFLYETDDILHFILSFFHFTYSFFNKLGKLLNLISVGKQFAVSLFQLHDSITFYSYAHFPIALVYLSSIKFDFD